MALLAICVRGPKVLPSSHSSATWCIMVDAFMWMLLFMSIRRGVLDITI